MFATSGLSVRTMLTERDSSFRDISLMLLLLLLSLYIMSPYIGGCSPIIVLRSVDLPIPFGPSRHDSSPSLNVALSSDATVFFEYPILRFDNVIDITAVYMLQS